MGPIPRSPYLKSLPVLGCSESPLLIVASTKPGLFSLLTVSLSKAGRSVLRHQWLIPTILATWKAEIRSLRLTLTKS
jgi:hypothetical protein